MNPSIFLVSIRFDQTTSVDSTVGLPSEVENLLVLGLTEPSSVGDMNRGLSALTHFLVVKAFFGRGPHRPTKPSMNRPKGARERTR